MAEAAGGSGPPRDSSEFPHITVPSGLRWFRLHRSTNGFAWFGNRTVFRFDPPSSHAARFGTCYFATEPIGAFIETMLGMGDPTQSEVDERRITSCEVKGVLRLANLTSPLVLGYRVDASFSASSGGDYAHSQDLAATLFDASFDGIWYALRHDPAHDLMGMALFGTQGRRTKRALLTSRPGRSLRRCWLRRRTASVSG